jgi:hypothetical protein
MAAYGEIPMAAVNPRMLRHEVVGRSGINPVSTYLGGASEIVF